MKQNEHIFNYIVYENKDQNLDISTIFCRIPDQYVCHLKDVNHPERPTLKFNSSKGDSPGDPGWKCINSDKKECLPKRHICDGMEECQYGSDEDKGCDLYPGNNCYPCYIFVRHKIYVVC